MLQSFAGLKGLFKTLLTLQRDTNPTISIITLNANGLNAPLRQRLLEWIKKKDPIVCHLQERHFKYKGTQR